MFLSYRKSLKTTALIFSPRVTDQVGYQKTGINVYIKSILCTLVSHNPSMELCLRFSYLVYSH